MTLAEEVESAGGPESAGELESAGVESAEEVDGAEAEAESAGESERGFPPISLAEAADWSGFLSATPPLPLPPLTAVPAAPPPASGDSADGAGGVTRGGAHDARVDPERPVLRGDRGADADGGQQAPAGQLVEAGELLGEHRVELRQREAVERLALQIEHGLDRRNHLVAARLRDLPEVGQRKLHGLLDENRQLHNRIQSSDDPLVVQREARAQGMVAEGETPVVIDGNLGG